MKILDISEYQPTVNWAEVKADKRYVIGGVYIKATEGVSITDPKLASHVQSAIDAKIPFGLYHFAHPNLNSGADEANHFLSVAKQYACNFIPVLDIEVPTSGMTQAHLNSWMQWWDKIITEHFPTYMIYSDRGYFDQYDFSKYTNHPLWIAAYQGTPPNTDPWPTYTMWQYTDAGQVSGISGKVDMSDVTSIQAISL